MYCIPIYSIYQKRTSINPHSNQVGNKVANAFFEGVVTKKERIAKNDVFEVTFIGSQVKENATIDPRLNIVRKLSEVGVKG